MKLTLLILLVAFIVHGKTREAASPVESERRVGADPVASRHPDGDREQNLERATHNELGLDPDLFAEINSRLAAEEVLTNRMSMYERELRNLRDQVRSEFDSRVKIAEAS